MQNMEKYFGFRVRVSDFLEPEDYNVVKNKIAAILAQHAEATTQYRVYLHQLVLEARPTQFGITGGLSARVNNVRLCLSINKKQRRTGDIKFMNYRFERELNEQVSHHYLAHEILYTISPKYFEEHGYFQNTLVTLVRIGMREQHKKIKVRVSVDPTSELVERLNRKEQVDSETMLDIDFRKAREFNRQTKLFIHPEEPAMSKEEGAAPRVSIKAKNIGAVVTDPNASTTVNIANSDVAIDHLLHELRVVAKSLHDDPPNGVEPEDIEIVDSVIADAPNDRGSFGKLITAGKWLGKRADKLGMTLLTEYLKQQAGL